MFAARRSLISRQTTSASGSIAWRWHLVVPQLELLGHLAIAVDLPYHDDIAGLEEYADTIVEAAGDRE